MNETLDNTSYTATPCSFSEAITVCMSKFATFTGRASRSELWWFSLFTLLLSWGATIVGTATGGPGMGQIFSIVVSAGVFLPSLAVGVRRLHDIGRSGWWWFLVLTIIGIFVLVYWWAQEGKPEQNEY